MSNLLWRDSGKTVRFMGVDGRVSLGIVIALIKIAIWTFALAVSLMIFFGILEKFDYTLPNAARKLRILITGKIKFSKHPLKERKYRTFY